MSILPDSGGLEEQDVSSAKDREDCYVRLFEIALRLKVATIGTGRIYEFVLCRPGTSFQNLEVEQNASSFQNTHSEPSHMWQHAILQVYEEVNEPRASLSRVCLKNFKEVVMQSSKPLHSAPINILKCINRPSSVSVKTS